jgi:methionyl-tRNA synthetase
MTKFYITTAIAYVNAAPHLGHALEFIQADVLARYHRMIGDETYFVTGTDEHGVKIYETAKEKGMETQAFVDSNAAKFKALEGLLSLSNDDFVRTSSQLHKDGAQKIWQKLVDKGDIYKGTYKGNYCVGCESFIPEKDLDEDGNCPTHKKKPELLEEDNYFFKLSAYSDAIKKLIESDELKIVPASRKKEMLNIIGEEGLHDVSFSRPKSALPWGVDVPGDENQVMYVWCDALSNYISILGYAENNEKVAKYWPADVHLIGKDILRFHAGIWIGMLLSAGEAIPKAVYVHGFVTSEGQKMSKSIGNVVDPLEYVEKYGVEAMRYFLMREIPTCDDGDFSHNRFVDLYNSDLANGLGNLVNRVTMMIEKYFDGKAPSVSNGAGVAEFVDNAVELYQKAFADFDLKLACEKILDLINFANKYIDDNKPWLMAKEENVALPVVMYNLLELLRVIAVMLFPYIPDTAEKIASQISLNAFVLNAPWGQIKEGADISKSEVLFPRIEEE